MSCETHEAFESITDDRTLQMIRTAHPCPMCGRESTYFWQEVDGGHQACVQHTPRYVLGRRAA
jgi:hypothetical protein